VPVSCINRWLGASRVDAIFSEVHGRSKWAIPWLEDDTGMIVPQLWAGRLRRDAADALAYKCTGLFGIHWRTKVLEPNFAVLAEAAWAQPWVPDEEMVLDAATRAELPRDMPCEDFYRQWCSSRFGCAVADRAAAILARMDGGGPANPDSFETAKPRTLPLPAVWIDGPGAIQPNPAPWSEEERRYDFVAELERLETAVQGVANQNRYAYWLNTFRLLRALGKLGCMRGELDRLVDRLPEVTDLQRRKALAEEALVLRVQLARQWEQMMTYQLACTDTPGAMGTIANLEQHSLGNLKFITKHDVAIADAIDRPLPERVHPTKRYLGRPRLIVPTVRSSVDCGEALSLKVIVLDNNRPKTARLHWRWMGQG